MEEWEEREKRERERFQLHSYLKIFRGDHCMKHNGPLIAKHFISPPPHRADELDRSNAIVSYKDLLNGTLSTIPVNKFFRGSHLLGGERERERERERETLSLAFTINFFAATCSPLSFLRQRLSWLRATDQPGLYQNKIYWLPNSQVWPLIPFHCMHSPPSHTHSHSNHLQHLATE